MAKTVDIYLPLDARGEPNRVVWPIAKKQLAEIVTVVRRCGWTPRVLNPDKPVASVAEGMKVTRMASGEQAIPRAGDPR